jgi:putative transposase
MRIVARVAREVQVSAGEVRDLVYHVVWCPKYRRRFLADRVAARCEGLNRTKASEYGWRIMALEIMPDHVHLFVKAHRSDSSSPAASQFKGCTSRRLRADCPHLRSRLLARWSWPYFAVMAGTVSAEAVRRYTGTQHGGTWRKERVR